MDNQKIYKTLEIIVKAVLAIAALWLCISCTMSMSISKNNVNSAQSTEQSQATSVDSTNVDLIYKWYVATSFYVEKEKKAWLYLIPFVSVLILKG